MKNFQRVCRWNDNVIKNVEIISETPHTTYGKLHLNALYFTEATYYLDEQTFKETVKALANGIDFRITCNGNVVIPLENQTNNDVIKSFYSFAKDYIQKKMYFVIDYRLKRKQRRTHAMYGMSDDLIEAVTTLVTTDNYTEIEPAMKVLVESFLRCPTTWSFNGHSPFYYSPSFFDLLTNYGTAYWFYVVAGSLTPYDRVKKLENDIFLIKEEQNLREKVLSILQHRVIYMDYPKTEELKGAIKNTPEDMFHEFSTELLFMLLSVIKDVFNDYELIALNT